MKMILAVIHQKDEDDTISKLNQSGFFVTKLATTGGLLKEKNTTIMTCIEDTDVEKAINCIKSTAKTRHTIEYINPYTAMSPISPGMMPLIPQKIIVGGCSIFVMNVEQVVKN